MTRSQIQTLINNIATGTPNTALTVRTVLNAIADGTAQTGDVKEIDVSNAYLTANFDASGLGTNERLGWVICNGNNGTRDRGGRVSLGYDEAYPELGATGGSADSVIGAHTHTVTTGNVNDGAVGGSNLSKRTARWDSGSGTTFSGITSSTGESVSGKNMQPYIVTLYIMKL